MRNDGLRRVAKEVKKQLRRGSAASGKLELLRRLGNDVVYVQMSGRVRVGGAVLLADREVGYGLAARVDVGSRSLYSSVHGQRQGAGNDRRRTPPPPPATETARALGGLSDRVFSTERLDEPPSPLNPLGPELIWSGPTGWASKASCRPRHYVPRIHPERARALDANRLPGARNRQGRSAATVIPTLPVVITSGRTPSSAICNSSLSKSIPS